MGEDSDKDRNPTVESDEQDYEFQVIEGRGGQWVEIASVGTGEEAKLICGFLEAEGIRAEIESVKFNMEPVNFGRMGEIRVYVPAESEEAAVNLLDERQTEYDHLKNDDSIVTDDGPANIEDGSETEDEER
ncbi:MAG: hypothetical protein WBX15_09050 [Thermoanaerobaculia bacterium]